MTWTSFDYSKPIEIDNKFMTIVVAQHRAYVRTKCMRTNVIFDNMKHGLQFKFVYFVVIILWNFVCNEEYVHTKLLYGSVGEHPNDVRRFPPVT